MFNKVDSLQLRAALAVALMLVGCEGRTASRTSRADVRVAEQARIPERYVPDHGVTILATFLDPSSMRLTPLCELAGWLTGGAGLYQVDRITSVEEETDFGLAPYSYVRLLPLEIWDGAALGETVIVRMEGGLTAKGFFGSPVELKQGEVLGAMLVPASPANKNYLSLHPLGAFQSQGERRMFSNGQLFVNAPKDAMALRRAISSAKPASEKLGL